ncbi:FAD-dependent monooxygenase [Streptomyces mirabilis]|uniref:FAD-dependent monooxygenase n=1 Tax=Streptomyces mirabilis TaxID=68239 RepID=UPI0036756F35
MNTGIQDALNLGWQLALARQGAAPEEPLETYEAERAPAGRNVPCFTDRAFTIATSRTPAVRLTRTQLAPRPIPLALRVTGMRGRVFRAVSELGIHYRHSPASSTGPRETLEAELISYFTPNEAERPAHLRSRRPRTDGPVRLNATGTLLLRFALPAGHPAPPFPVHLRRRGTRNGKPVVQSLDVAGHREIRFRSFDASRDFLTTFPVFDERLLAFYERLHHAATTRTSSRPSAACSPPSAGPGSP